MDQEVVVVVQEEVVVVQEEVVIVEKMVGEEEEEAEICRLRILVKVVKEAAAATGACAVAT